MFEGTRIIMQLIVYSHQVRTIGHLNELIAQSNNLELHRSLKLSNAKIRVAVVHEYFTVLLQKH